MEEDVGGSLPGESVLSYSLLLLEFGDKFLRLANEGSFQVLLLNIPAVDVGRFEQRGAHITTLHPIAWNY